MKNLMKGIASLLLIAIMILGVSVLAHADEKIDYTCGKHATWSYNEDTETLTISGKGKVRSNWEWDELEPKTIIIKKGITKISGWTFSGMTSVEKVEIPNSVKEIGYGAFNRTSITEIDIPDSVVEIGNSAFAKTKLTEVEIGSNVKILGGSIFTGCKKLMSVTWNADKIPGSTFSGCKNLKDVKLSDGLAKIGDYAFYNTAVTAIEMPNTVTTIGSNVFGKCKALEKLVISEKVKVIPGYFISGTENLKSVSLPKGVKTIKTYAFYNSYVETVTLPENLEMIEQSAFATAKNLKSIKIPSKVGEIYDYTFDNCKNLKEVDLGKTITNIGEGAFKSCIALEEITIPGSVEAIGYETFAESGIKKVIIEEGVKSIEYWAFNKCEKLTSVVIGKTVDFVAENAFSNCGSLVNIEVSADNFYYAAADGCLTSKDGITLITVPAGKSGVFEMPAGVKKIEATAFYGCTKITGYASTNNRYFVVEDGILYNVVKTTLFSCPSSKTGTITIPNTVTYIADAAFQYSKASNILIPNSVTTIGYCAFEYCENLTSITLPGSIKRIGNAAFWDCKNLKRVVIGKGTQKINRNAFHGCENLKKITIPQSVVKIAKSAFSGCGYGVTFYCKKSSAAMSYANKNWRINSKII